jgi:hypothetical protein
MPRHARKRLENPQFWGLALDYNAPEWYGKAEKPAEHPGETLLKHVKSVILEQRKTPAKDPELTPNFRKTTIFFRLYLADLDESRLAYNVATAYIYNLTKDMPYKYVCPFPASPLPSILIASCGRMKYFEGAVDEYGHERTNMYPE